MNADSGGLERSYLVINDGRQRPPSGGLTPTGLAEGNLRKIREDLAQITGPYSEALFTQANDLRDEGRLNRWFLSPGGLNPDLYQAKWKTQESVSIGDLAIKYNSAIRVNLKKGTLTLDEFAQKSTLVRNLGEHKQERGCSCDEVLLRLNFNRGGEIDRIRFTSKGFTHLPGGNYQETRGNFHAKCADSIVPGELGWLLAEFTWDQRGQGELLDKFELDFNLAPIPQVRAITRIKIDNTSYFDHDKHGYMRQVLFQPDTNDFEVLDTSGYGMNYNSIDWGYRTNKWGKGKLNHVSRSPYTGFAGTPTSWASDFSYDRDDSLLLLAERLLGTIPTSEKSMPMLHW